MAVHYRTRGFVIKKTDRGEADQLFTIYTKDFGKLEILGKAIRKIKSKLRGGIELFYLSEIEFIQGKTYKTLTDAILIESFSKIRKDLERLFVANKIAESLDDLVKGQEPDMRIWDLLNEVFQKIENLLKIENLKLKIIYYYFLWNFFSILGYKPELYHCSSCQKRLVPGIFYFSLDLGGVVCRRCVEKPKKSQAVSQDLVKTVRLLLNKDWRVLSKLKIDINSQRLLEKISQSYFDEILNKN